MPSLPLRAVLLPLLFATPIAAQTADLALKINADPVYNAGEISTLRATVTNLGPDTATAAGVRLTKLSSRFVYASPYGCIDMPDSVLCNIPTLAAGESHEFIVPFAPPDHEGSIQLSARTESFTLDPTHDNDAATATAQVVKLADLSVEFSVYPSLRPQRSSRLYVLIRNHAALHPDTVTLLVTFPDPLVVEEAVPNCQTVGATTYRCSIGMHGADNSSAYFEIVPMRAAPPVTITASVQSSEADWNPSDNTVSQVLPIYEVPDLDVRITSPDALDANNETVATYTFTNASDFAATNVQAEIVTYPGNPRLVDGNGWSCKPYTTYRMQCTNALIAPHSTSTLRIAAQFDKQYLRGAFGLYLTQKPTPDFTIQLQSAFIDAVFYKPFTVTTTASSGGGSLRQAILDANAECSSDDGSLPCAIRFDVGGTIAPESPLPLITVTDFAIDGESKITLDGSRAGDADGLYLFNAGAVVRGLTIRNFAKNAILSITHRNPFLTRHHVIEHNNLSGNGLRGVMAYTYEGEITANVMHDNTRSAIFLTDQSFATIRDNDIDGNGASGIYIGGASSAVIENNSIADSPAFGIAIDRSSRAEIFENHIVNNGQPGIDLGLDGPTLSGTPAITSARFDPSTGDTIIEGVIAQTPNAYPVTTMAYVYANTRDEAGGDLFLGSQRTDASGHFTLRYHGDLTGKYIDAMTYIIIDFGDYVLRQSTEFGARFRA